MESARSIEPDHPFETLPAEGITAVFFCTLLLFLLSFQKYNELFCVEGNSVTQAFPGITQSTTGSPLNKKPTPARSLNRPNSR